MMCCLIRLEELAQPYFILTEAGFTVDVASPKVRIFTKACSPVIALCLLMATCCMDCDSQTFTQGTMALRWMPWAHAWWLFEVFRNPVRALATYMCLCRAARSPSIRPQ